MATTADIAACGTEQANAALALARHLRNCRVCLGLAPVDRHQPCSERLGLEERIAAAEAVSLLLDYGEAHYDHDS